MGIFKLPMTYIKNVKSVPIVNVDPFLKNMMKIKLLHHLQTIIKMKLLCHLVLLKC